MCDRCDDGRVLNGRTNNFKFCDCPVGQRRREAWEHRNALVLAEAECRRRRVEKKIRDFKNEAAGNGERWPGEEG